MKSFSHIYSPNGKAIFKYKNGGKTAIPLLSKYKFTRESKEYREFLMNLLKEKGIRKIIIGRKKGKDLYSTLYKFFDLTSPGDIIRQKK